MVFLVWASLVAQMVKNIPAMQETQVQPLGREDPLEKRIAKFILFYLHPYVWSVLGWLQLLEPDLL